MKKYSGTPNLRRAVLQIIIRDPEHTRIITEMLTNQLNHPILEALFEIFY